MERGEGRGEFVKRALSADRIAVAGHDDDDRGKCPPDRDVARDSAARREYTKEGRKEGRKEREVLSSFLLPFFRPFSAPVNWGFLTALPDFAVAALLLV